MPIDPSIALQIRPPQFDSPMQGVQQALSLKSMVNAQAIQAQQMKAAEQDLLQGTQNLARGAQGLEIGKADLTTAQQRAKAAERDTAGQELLTGLLQENTAFDDTDGLKTNHKAVTEALLKAGRTDIAASYAKQQKEIETAMSDALLKDWEVKQKQNERLSSWASILKNADPTQRAALYPTVVQGLVSEGLLPEDQMAKLPKQYTPELDPQIDAFVAQSQTAATQLEQNLKRLTESRAKAVHDAEIAGKTAKTTKEKIDAAQAEQEIIGQVLGAATTPDAWQKGIASLAGKVSEETLKALPAEYSPAAAAMAFKAALKPEKLAEMQAAESRLRIEMEQRRLDRQQRDDLAEKANDARIAAAKVGAGAKPPSEGERTAFRFYQRMADAVQDLSNVDEAIAKLGLGGQTWLKMAPNFAQTEIGQLYTQAQRAFTEARLRKDSGAAIPEKEFENDRKTYFVEPGDGDKVIAQKVKSRKTALDALKISSGKAYTETYGEEEKDTTTGPKKGDVVDGYEFLGGNPAEQKNWKKK